MTFEDASESTAAQNAIDRLESRLTALQEAGVEVAPLLSHLVHAHGLFAAEDFTAAASFCGELLQLATRIAEGRESERSSAQRAQILLSTYPLPSSGHTAAIIGETIAVVVDAEDVPTDFAAHDEVSDHQRTEGGTSPVLHPEPGVLPGIITQRLDRLQDDLSQLQESGISAIGGQMSAAIARMTEWMMEGIQSGFQQLAEQAEQDREAFLQQLQTMPATDSAPADEETVSEVEAFDESEVIEVEYEMSAAESEDQVEPVEEDVEVASRIDTQEAGKSMAAADSEPVVDEVTQTEDITDPAETETSEAAEEIASTVEGIESETDLAALIDEIQAAAPEAETVDEPTDEAEEEATATDVNDDGSLSAPTIDALMAEAAADVSSEQSAAEGASSNELSESDLVDLMAEVSDEITSAEYHIAEAASVESDALSEEELMAALGAAEVSDASADDDSSQEVPEAEMEQPEAAFAAADEVFGMNKEEAITEIKELTEEDDLTKLTDIVERTRSLIADTEEQIDALNEVADEQPAVAEALPLASKEESGSLSPCMSKLDQELESLLDELATTPLTVGRIPEDPPKEVGFDAVAAEVSDKQSRQETEVETNADIGAGEPSETETIAQLMAALPDPEESAKATKTSPLLPPEVDSGLQTSSLAAAEDGEALPAPVPLVPVVAATPSPTADHAVSDERIRGIIQEQLLAALDSPAVQQKIFAMLALEAAVNPSALAELSGVRAFLKSEMERILKQRSADFIV